LARLITGLASTRLRADERLEVEARSGWPPDPQGPSSTGSDNDVGAAPGDEPGGAARREKPLNGTSPGRGSGMKQAPEPRCGSNRREAVNACGRNVAGLGKSRGQ
jgi:hypothetical protein